MTKSPLQAFICLFNIVFYLFVIVSVAVIIVEITRWVRKDYTASYGFVSIDPNDLANYLPEKHPLTSANPAIVKPYLETSKWKIAFDAHDLSVKVFMSLMAFLQIIYLFLILMTLRSFVMSLKHNEAFSLQNIRRLRNLGILLILIEPLAWISKFLRKQWVIDNLNIQFADRSLSYRVGYTLGAGEFVWNWILAGLLVLVIAGVFRQGLTLKEEVDLTV